jgi:hypothetical protein
MKKSGRKTKRSSSKTGRSRRTKTKTKKRKTKAIARRASARRTPAKASKKLSRKRKIPLKRKRAAPPRRVLRGDADFELATTEPRGLGLEAGGQSGDTEGLSRAEIEDSESVEELVEEGQAFEAAAISGVEDAPDADRGGVRTRQVPEDDVPEEYLPEKT